VHLQGPHLFSRANAPDSSMGLLLWASSMALKDKNMVHRANAGVSFTGIDAPPGG